MVRIGAALVAVAALSVGVMADPTPVVPVTLGTAPGASSPDLAIDLPSLPPAPGTSAPVALPIGDAVPSPAPGQATGTVVPLPPGIYVGLVGLASAAIARRRFLKRH